jgi:hypothetical protein
MTGIYSTKLPQVEWLFKQSSFGGAEHIIVNVDDVLEYFGNIAPPEDTVLRIETLCGKNLKYSTTYSVVRQKEGLLRNVCPDCVMQNGVKRPEKKTTEEDNLPF